MKLRIVGIVVALGLLAFAARAAMSVHTFKLKANGTEIKGESTVLSLDRADSIECLSFHQTVTLGPKGVALGTIRIRKRIDKSSPLLIRALHKREVIEGAFRFFRPNPGKAGTTEHFYTVKIAEGRITKVTTIVPDVIDPETANQPAVEEVVFSFKTVEFVYEIGGVAHIIDKSKPD